MKAGTRIRWTLALLLSLLVLPAAGGQARQADESGASRKCLLCHGKKGIVKTFLNEETVEAYVNPEKIRASVHNFLTCSECHSGFSAESHPSGQYKSRDQYRLRSSSICRRCHSADKIKNKAVTQGKVDPNLLSKIDEDAKLMVFNGDGSVLGTFAGTYPQAPIAILQVLIDGGLYSYYGSGQLIPFATESVSYKNASCSGTPYVELDSQGFDFIFSKLAGGPSRVVYRPFTGPTNLGPISAWQFTTRSEDVTGQNLWELHSDGTCDPTSSSPYTGLLGELESVSPPPDGIGPLTVG